MFRQLTTPRQAVRNCHKSSRLGTPAEKPARLNFCDFERAVQCGILPESQSEGSCLPVKTLAKKNAEIARAMTERNRRRSWREVTNKNSSSLADVPPVAQKKER